MIFADKLIDLRKKAGMTQEELAEKMNVSRQSIAKWEGAQSVPELSKIVKLSEMFGVSTDYLLKDEIEMAEHAELLEGEGDVSLRKVSLSEANEFLASRRRAAKPIATGVLLCIFSPICLILLACMSEYPKFHIGENLAAGLGILILLVMVAIAVAVFVTTGNKNSRYEYLEKELIDTEYGVDGMVKENRARFKDTYDRYNLIGIVMCVLAAVPIFLGIILNENNDMLMVAMVCLTLVLVGIAVYIFIRVGVIWASFEKLLQDGDFTIEKKKENKTIIGTISTSYWLIATAIYLGYGFATNKWHTSWVVWVVAGILYPVVMGIARSIYNKK